MTIRNAYGISYRSTGFRIKCGMTKEEISPRMTKEEISRSMTEGKKPEYDIRK